MYPTFISVPVCVLISKLLGVHLCTSRLLSFVCHRQSQDIFPCLERLPARPFQASIRSTFRFIRMLRFLGLKYAGFFAADDVVRQGLTQHRVPCSRHTTAHNKMGAYDSERVEVPCQRFRHFPNSTHRKSDLTCDHSWAPTVGTVPSPHFTVHLTLLTGNPYRFSLSRGTVNASHIVLTMT